MSIHDLPRTLYIQGWRCRQVARNKWHATRKGHTLQATTARGLTHKIEAHDELRAG